MIDQIRLTIKAKVSKRARENEKVKVKVLSNLDVSVSWDHKSWHYSLLDYDIQQSRSPRSHFFFLFLFFSITVVQEVSKLWRHGLSEEERTYYNQFANEAQEVYNRQMIEYRATGTFTPHEEFIKVPGANVWVRQPSKQNALEQEICQYETMVFPPRPPSMDEAFEERQRRGIFRRKLRLKGLMSPDGTLKDGLDFEELYQEHLAKDAKKSKGADTKEEQGTTSSGDDEVEHSETN